MIFRVGIGQDSHLFELKKIKSLHLGGVKISNRYGLKGNSDGDVILHSICNALSSAIGGDSLGTWSDKMCLEQGIIDSRKYVEYIFNNAKKKEYNVGNIAISIEAKRPHLSLEEIKQIKITIAQILEISVEQVGVTFTSGEGLTAFGKGKGIQALTIISLVKYDKS